MLSIIAQTHPSLSHSCVESLFAAICLDVVDNGSVKGRGAADPPGAHQDDTNPDLTENRTSFMESPCSIILTSCKVFTTSWWNMVVKLIPLTFNV